jgi:hypothetical protein
MVDKLEWYLSCTELRWLLCRDGTRYSKHDEGTRLPERGRRIVPPEDCTATGSAWPNANVFIRGKNCWQTLLKSSAFVKKNQCPYWATNFAANKPAQCFGRLRMTFYREKTVLWIKEWNQRKFDREARVIRLNDGFHWCPPTTIHRVEYFHHCILHQIVY